MAAGMWSRVLKDPITIRPEWRRIFHDSYAMDAIRRELERILEEENRKLKQLVADLSLDKKMLQDVLSKKL